MSSDTNFSVESSDYLTAYPSRLGNWRKKSKNILMYETRKIKKSIRKTIFEWCNVMLLSKLTNAEEFDELHALIRVLKLWSNYYKYLKYIDLVAPPSKEEEKIAMYGYMFYN